MAVLEGPKHRVPAVMGRRLLLLAVVLSVLSVPAGCRFVPPPVVLTAAPTASTTVAAHEAPVAPSPTALPQVPGLSSAEVASLASLEKVDDYPLYVMHHYDLAASAASPQSAVSTTPVPLWACSLFAALGDPDAPVFGRNFDWSYSPALVLFTYPQDGYASASIVDLGYFIEVSDLDRLDELPLKERRALLTMWRHPFDGMNEQGLVVGMAAVPDSRVPASVDRPSIGSLGIIREILDHARNVDEALTTMRSFNVDMEGGPPIHYLIADPSGRSVLVEFYDGEMVAISNDGPWHATTNFYRAAVAEGGPSPCRRYDTLVDRLEERSGRLTAAEAMSLLSDVAQQNTQWSVIYGMQSGEIRVVLGRQYERVHALHLTPSRSGIE
ncbi:MAG: linear amide C-N hydrolase [Anaerolineae bacterium]